MFSPSTSVSPANSHSTDYSTIIVDSGRSTKWTQSHPMRGGTFKATSKNVTNFPHVCCATWHDIQTAFTVTIHTLKLGLTLNE
jgi:hypothetical protein